MPTPVTPRAECRWISAQRTAKILEVSGPTAAAILNRASVTRQQYPGAFVRYLLDDVIRVREQSIRRPTPLTRRKIMNIEK
jgi:hypothetical protein